MRLKNLDLNLLVALDALLAEKSITKASNRLNLSQPGTSAALARLREFFGDELLVPVGRKMMLTPRGESLTKPVRDVLLQIHAIIDAPDAFDPAESRRHFSFVMSDYTATVLAPQLLRDLHALAPMITAEFTSPSDLPTEALDRGEVDFLLLPENLLSDHHPRISVFSDEFVCVAWADNPRLGETLDIDTYFSLGHVVARLTSQRVPSVDEWLTSNQARTRRIEVITASFNAVPQYLVGTSRIATMHHRLAKTWASHFPIKIIEAPVKLPSITWGLQWQTYRNHDQGTLWMRDLVISVAQKESFA